MTTDADGTTARPLQPVVEGHGQIHSIETDMRLVQTRPEVLPRPVLVPAVEAGEAAASIYGSVIRDGGTFRMWYQSWPPDDAPPNSYRIGYAESDDGLSWRRPALGQIEPDAAAPGNLLALPLHSPSVVIDPDADPDARYRAFGHIVPERLGNDYAMVDPSRPAGYYAARSPDGLSWRLDGREPIWGWADVMTACHDPHLGCIRLAMKRNDLVGGFHRRCIYSAEFRDGEMTPPVAALIPDDFDDVKAVAEGFRSADYYGMATMPTAGATFGVLWVFRHRRGGDHNLGQVFLSLVVQHAPGSRWLHLPGRSDWASPDRMPPWARGCLYSAAYPIDVGDETWLYFTGTAHEHGWHQTYGQADEVRRRAGAATAGMQIGLLRWPRGRLLGYRAPVLGTVRLRAVPAGDGDPGELALDAATEPGGAVRVGLTDRLRPPYETLPGYGLADCDVIGGDHRRVRVTWSGRAGLPRLDNGRNLLAIVEASKATLFGFRFTAPESR